MRIIIAALICGAACGAVCFLNSCSTAPAAAFAPPEIPGAHFVGNQACLDCHANYVRIFPTSPHARVRFNVASSTGVPPVRLGGSQDFREPETHGRNARATNFGCESCHGPGSKHIEVGGGRGKFIVNPGKDPSACFQCHLDVHAEFELPQHHPVIEGRMNCVQCHDPHGSEILKPAGGLAMARLNESCAQCHREQAQPFVFEHEALREGCTVCHNPHGSVNRKLLVEADDNLCLRCHAQVQGPGVARGEIFIGKVPHTTLLQMGACWSAGCHTAVHGSNVQPRMLF